MTTGKYSQAVCDRCGFTYPYLSMREEAGTGWFVCEFCDDGIYNLVDHPQNESPDVDEDISLENARPDVVLVSAVPVSAWLSKIRT